MEPEKGASLLEIGSVAVRLMKQVLVQNGERIKLYSVVPCDGEALMVMVFCDRASQPVPADFFIASGPDGISLVLSGRLESRHFYVHPPGPISLMDFGDLADVLTDLWFDRPVEGWTKEPIE